MLCLRIFKIVLVMSFITHVFVNGGAVQSSFMDWTRQLMKVERRPYTKTATDPSTTGPTHYSNFDKILVPTFREMHRYCDGQCFYAPSACATSNAVKDCEVAASVAAHNPDKDGELYCDFFGPDNLKQSFCVNSDTQKKYQMERMQEGTNDTDRFYTITLHRTLSPSQEDLTCHKKWNVETGRKCRRSEFVGISFINAESQEDLDEEDLWYICIVDESHLTRISMWTKITNSTGASVQRIMGTKPHLESGAGVVYSKVLIDPDTSSMGCQFIIQESNMTLRNPPKNAAFFSNRTSTIRVKLGTGIVQRDNADDSVVRPFYDNNKNAHFKPKVYHGANVKPTDTIFFDSMKVNITESIIDSDIDRLIQEEEEHRKMFKTIIRKCDTPSKYPSLYIACYPPNRQLNCIHTGRCPAMFIVEIPRADTSFNTIKAYLYSLTPEYKSLRKVETESPTSYVSVGFSFDGKMGSDVVISCHASGMNNVSVFVSINFDKANLYPGKVDYNSLVYNTNTYRTVGRVNKILCSWEMKTKFFVNMFEYEPDYIHIIPPGESEKLEYDFINQEVWLLLAAGNRNYPNGRIVFHDFRQALGRRFSREKFLEAAKGNRNVPHFSVYLIIVVLNFLRMLF